MPEMSIKKLKDKKRLNELIPTRCSN